MARKQSLQLYRNATIYNSLAAAKAAAQALSDLKDGEVIALRYHDSYGADLRDDQVPASTNYHTLLAVYCTTGGNGGSGYLEFIYAPEEVEKALGSKLVRSFMVEEGVVKAKMADGSKQSIYTIPTYSIDYSSTDQKIYLKKDGTAVGEGIDCTDFIKDGMVSNVTYDPATHKATITFNTDAGKQPIEVDLSGLVDTYTGSDNIVVDNNVIYAKDLTKVTISDNGLVTMAHANGKNSGMTGTAQLAVGSSVEGKVGYAVNAIHADAATDATNATNATNAAEAAKLSTDAGDETHPVYFENGVPVQCSAINATGIADGTVIDGGTF